MVAFAQTSPVEPEDLLARCTRLEQENIELTARLRWFEEQYRLSQMRLFGNSREHTPEQQAFVFNELEANTDPVAPEPIIPDPTVETITYQRRKTAGKREAQLANLPVETIHYELTDEEKVCSVCEGQMHRMSEQVRQELKIVPAQICVVKHVQGVYACRSCEQNAEPNPIITAPMPAPAFPGSLASSTAVAYIMDQKFTMGLPLYRLEQSFERMDMELSRQTLANWMVKGATWLELIYDRLHHHLIQRDILHADDTKIQVLHEEGRKPQTDSTMWLYCTGRTQDNLIAQANTTVQANIVLFDYQTSRAGEYPKTFLAGFEGFLICDGHDVYEKLPGVIPVGCWAHARRGFFEAVSILPANVRNGEKKTLAHQGLAFCDQIFKIERDLQSGPAPSHPHAVHGVSYQDRLANRMERSKPVIDEFRLWLEKAQPMALPKSATGKAINYCRNQWPKLTVFLTDGRLEIDNNRAERSIKPFVIGRKNWLFANTPKGARASAIIYSIVETAKENGLVPYDYLTYLFEKLPNIDTKDTAALDALMPWDKTVANHSRSPLKPVDATA